MIEELALLLARRKEPTTWVKIKSHTSVELSKRADEHAARAPFEPESVSKQYIAAEDANLIQFFSEDKNQEVMAKPEELRDHFIQLRSMQVLCKQTRTTRKMTAVGVGLHLLHHVLWKESGPYSVDNRTAKRMLQCITNTYPTKSR